jgi:hypothetical protein
MVAAFKQALCILRWVDAGWSEEGLAFAPDDEACSQSMSKPSCSWAVELLAKPSRPRPRAATNNSLIPFIDAF